jgi:hypothetical protein
MSRYVSDPAAESPLRQRRVYSLQSFAWMAHIPVLGRIVALLNRTVSHLTRFGYLDKIPDPINLLTKKSAGWRGILQQQFLFLLFPFKFITRPLSSWYQAALVVLLPFGVSLWHLGAVLLRVTLMALALAVAGLLKYGAGLPLAAVGLMVHVGYCIAERTTGAVPVRRALRDRLLCPLQDMVSGLLADLLNIGLIGCISGSINALFLSIAVLTVAISPLAVLITLPVRAALTWYHYPKGQPEVRAARAVEPSSVVLGIPVEEEQPGSEPVLLTRLRSACSGASALGVDPQMGIIVCNPADPSVPERRGLFAR